MLGQSPQVRLTEKSPASPAVSAGLQLPAGLLLPPSVPSLEDPEIPTQNTWVTTYRRNARSPDAELGNHKMQMFTAITPVIRGERLERKCKHYRVIRALLLLSFPWAPQYDLLA